MDLDDELADKHRMVFMTGKLEAERFDAARRRALELSLASDEPVAIVIDSMGGHMEPALFCYDFLRSLPCPVHTYAIGKCYSAAFDLFLCGERRFSFPHARFRIHNVCANLEQLPYHSSRFKPKLKRMINEVARLTDEALDLYASASALKRKRIRKMMDVGDEVGRDFGPVKMFRWGFVTDLTERLPWNP